MRGVAKLEHLMGELVIAWRSEAARLRERYAEEGIARICEVHANEIEALVGRAFEPPPAPPGPTTEPAPPSIIPDRLYDSAEAAEFLGIKSKNGLYSISAMELAPTYVGSRRGTKRYRGSDILQYMENGRRPLGWRPKG